MLNKNYFNYLIKSKKYFLIVLCIIQAIFAFTGFGKSPANLSFLGNSVIISYAFGGAVAFILPLVIFSYVHDKRAVDTYFSLNVSRKSLLFTGLIFCLWTCFSSYLVTIIITAIGYLVSGILVTYLKTLLLALLISFISYTLVIVFNTFVYLFANSIVDGIIVLIAYYFLPLALYIMAITFQGTFLVGVSYVEETLSNYLAYLSPITLSIYNFLGVGLFGEININVSISYIIVSIIYIVIFAILLFKTFISRKVERAGNYSDYFFAYPFVITCYTIICLFAIASMYRKLTDDYSFIILYLLLFIAYLAGNFIYKRKFKLSKAQTIMFCIGVVLSLLFNIACEKTHGFGLSYAYHFEYGKVSYVFYSNDIKDDLDETKDFYEFIKSCNGFDETGFDDDEYGFYFNLHVGSDDKEVADIMENYRIQAIENYYDDSRTIGGNLDITYNSGKKSYTSCYSSSLISVDDIKTILKNDSNSNMEICDWETGVVYHVVYDDGAFILLNDEYYKLYKDFGLDMTRNIENATTEGSN